MDNLRFHVNPATGAVGACKASVRCPFGAMETDHYPSATAARAAFEASMTGATVAPSQRLTPQSTVPLASVLDLELLERDIAEGFIGVREHEDDPTLKVLCYSKTTQVTGHWTEATKVARGLIVRGEERDFSDAEILQRPWRKFFTLDQLSSGDWVLGDEEREGTSVEAELSKIDFSAPAEVTDKMDGSLGILYTHPDGRPALATKGSFASEQALYYTKLLRNTALGEEAVHLLQQEADKTFLFEMVGRDNRIVLDYPEDGVVLLGAVRKPDGLYLSANSYAERWSGGVTETMEAATVGEALALPDRPQREGVVIRVLSEDPERQMQLKVKQDDYKMLHRAVTGFSKSDMRASLRDSSETVADLIEAGRTGDVTRVAGVKRQLELLGEYPLLGGVKEEREQAYREIMQPRLSALVQAKDFVDSLAEDEVTGPDAAKKFAARVAKMEEGDRSDYFSLFNARAKGRSLGSIPGSNILRSMAREV